MLTIQCTLTPRIQSFTRVSMHLEVRELLLYLGSFLTVPFDLLLKLLLPPHLATAVHPVINSLIDLICFTIVSFIWCRGKQTTTIASKLRKNEEAMNTTYDVQLAL